jgi:hypothetical protein
MLVLIVNHRVNTLAHLIEVDRNQGVEIDIRNWETSLILNHEPFADGVQFADWLKECNSPLLILNVKSEGLEYQVIEDIKSSGFIGEYFFLDQSFPFLVRTLESGLSDSAVRVSEYESPECLRKLSNKWVWIDSHTGNWDFLPTAITIAKETGKKICIASPELHSRPADYEVSEIKKMLAEFDHVPEAVCTKSPKLWESM